MSPAKLCRLTLVDTSRFSKITLSLDQQVTWMSWWGHLTLTHNPTKLNGHWSSETGDAPFSEYNVIAWYMSHVTRWLGWTQLQSHLTKIGGHCPSKGEDKAFFLHVTWSYDQWVVRIAGWDTLTLNHKGYSKSERNSTTKMRMYCKLG